MPKAESAGAIVTFSPGGERWRRVSRCSATLGVACERSWSTSSSRLHAPSAAAKRTEVVSPPLAKLRLCASGVTVVFGSAPCPQEFDVKDGAGEDGAGEDGAGEDELK